MLKKTLLLLTFGTRITYLRLEVGCWQWQCALLWFYAMQGTMCGIEILSMTILVHADTHKVNKYLSMEIRKKIASHIFINFLLGFASLLPSMLSVINSACVKNCRMEREREKGKKNKPFLASQKYSSSFFPPNFSDCVDHKIFQ